MGLFLESNEDPMQPKGAQWSWWASLFVLCAMLGILLGLSFKTQKAIREQGGLNGSYDKNLNNQVVKDQLTIASLQSEKNKLEGLTSSAGQKSALLSSDLQLARYLAGLTDVTGPGVIVTLNDSKKRLLDAPTDIQNLYIIHDHDINTAINELKGAGAEAFSVNGQRVVVTTPIRCVGNNVFVNNTHQTPPYKIVAIGDPKTLQDGINLPGGFADGLRAIDPAMISIVKSPSLRISAFSGAVNPQYAHPVNAGLSDTTTKK